MPDTPTVLVVDDDTQVLHVHERALLKQGFHVTTAADGAEAVAALQTAAFDVVISDIDMPGVDGITLLERIRALDLDVPVIFITGRPSMETAIQALDRGALRYLTKPVSLEALVKITRDAVRLHRIAKAKRDAVALLGSPDRFVGDLAGLATNFDRALDALYMVYQPIVLLSERRIYGYEALLRSREPNLPTPLAVIDAAERLGRIHDLGRRTRMAAIEPLDRLPADVKLFLNLHPDDLLDDRLHTMEGPVAASADRIVLEITERASLDRIPDIRSRVSSLRMLGFKIALDDLGAGYGGLTSFSLLEPDIVKLDMGLVQRIDREPTKQRLVTTMVGMCAELDIDVTVEGVETAEERDLLVRLGCDLFQGYLFARPGEAFPEPAF